MKKRWGNLAKRVLVLGLAASMVTGSVDLSALRVSAHTGQVETRQAEKAQTTTVKVTGFDALSDKIMEQQLPVGAKESDILFPKSLKVTVEKTVTQETDEEDEEESSKPASEDDQKDSEEGDVKDAEDQEDTGADQDAEGQGEEKDSDTGEGQNEEDGSATGEGQDEEKDSDTGEGQDEENGQDAGEGQENGSSSEDGQDAGNGTDSQSSDNGNGGESTPEAADTQENAGKDLIGRVADWFFAPITVYAAEDAVEDKTEQKDGQTGEAGEEAGTEEVSVTTEEVCLAGIIWEIDAEESDASEFDGSKNGFCYVYKPVLPDTDGDGNQLTVGDDVELPVIYVLVGQYGIALLADGTIEVTETDADGTEKAPYTAQDLATWIGEHGSANLQKVSIKLLNNDTSITKELTIDTDLAKEIELDLDGHTLTLAAGARLYFIKSVNITITSSDSNKGTITGSCNYRNKVKGEGLVTADRDSMLTIKHVTIENAGTGPTVAMWGGVTCTIDNASISGSSGDQVGIITIVKGKACTITNTKVTGNVWSDYGTIMFTDSCFDCTIGNGAVIENKNSGGRCVAFGSYVKKGSVKITIKKGATLTANDGNGIIMNTSYGTVAVNIEGGTFNGRLRLPDNSQIAGGTFAPASDNAIWVNNSKKTLQDLLKVGYTLQYDDDGTYADLTARWTDEGRKVMAVKSPLYFMTHPTISSGAETVMENYTAAEAPELTVKAVSGSGSISYQWYADETINGTTTKVEQTGQGAKTATYRIPTGLSAGTYQYYCVATCGNDTATSKKAAFTVEEGVAEVTVGGNTTRYATLTKAIAAMKDAVDAADAELEITLKILKNISESGSEWKIDGNTKKVSFRMDLNGCTVIGNGLYITGEGVEAVFKDTSTGQNGTLNAPISIQSKAKLTVENGNYTKNLNFSGGATGELEGGHYSQSIYIGNTNSDNTGISCTITGGTYDGREVRVCGGAALSVSGADTKIETLQIDHSKNLRAEVTLSGGEYKIITLGAFFGSDDDLLDKEQRYAIEDTLAEGYAFYSSGIKTDISRTEKTLNNVKVLSADTPEDASLAVVKFQIEKNDGGTKTKYFLTWDAAMSSLEATESNLNNRQEYATWKKLEILLLKDAEATRGHVLADKKYLPAEITLRSEGDAPHSLTGKVNYLFKTGEQDVTIKNINVVGNISFCGDTVGTQTQDAAVLRLGEGVTGLEDVAVPSGKAEIVIEKGAKIPGTFSGEESNLDASIYCNHDTADISSRIESGTKKFKVWFPIELGGIALPTDGENDTNVTQRDGATYGLYSNGGTTDQKIKVTGEVCSYEPYGGKAVTIDTTDLSFTMPSSKVTLKAHTKDDYGYCDSCQKTDLAEAYKNGHLHIEGLVGRTYDSYPQVMTGVTLDTANGNKSLTGPSYKSGRELAQDSTDPANADISKANYYVVYANNIDCYRNEEGGSDFKADEAPKVTITGQGSYYGTIEHYFTIGYGEVVGEGFSGYQGTYDGKAHGAVQYGTVRLKADAVDSQTMIPVADGLIVPCTGKTMETDGFASNFTYYFVLMYYENGVSQGYKQINDPVTENHMITNAGNYTIYVSIHEARKNMCASLPIGVKATIEPRSLTDSVIHLDDIGITVYYTGMPIIPENWDRGITDSNRKNEPGNDQGVLDKDKDFTVSAENNKEVTNGKRDGKITFTGIGNYKGELVRYFDIAHAFTLAQTTVSKNCWYNEDSNWWKNGIPATFTENDVTSDNPVSDWKNIVYRTAKGKYAIVSDEVVFYASLEDAVAGKNPGYTFKEEGTHTVTLYGKDPWNQSIVPVEITINIDTTAPTWADADGKEDGYGIQIKDNWWRTLLNKISFGHLYNDTTLDIKIHANDAKEGVNKVSGVSKYYYYIDQITDTASATGKTKAELDTLAADGKFTQVDAGNWLSDSATIHGALGNDGSYVVYAYALDNAGNQSDYICTDGLVWDASAPVVTVTAPKKEDGTLKDTEATLKVNLSEDATLMWFFVSEGEITEETDYNYEKCKTNIESYMNSDPKYRPFAVQKDGKWNAGTDWYYNEATGLFYTQRWVQKNENSELKHGRDAFPAIFKIEGTKGENTIKLSDFGQPNIFNSLCPNKKTAVWIAAIDKAGNITAPIQPIEFTTTKAMPKVTTLPVVSGVYGDKTNDLKMTQNGVAQYDGNTITGTWAVNVPTDDTHMWKVNDTGKCLVTFTPDASYNGEYEAAVVEVTPTIAPRPVTIKVEDIHKVYNVPFMGIEDLKFKIAMDADGKSPLVGTDTEDTIKATLALMTDNKLATEGIADVGTYPFHVTSTSADYNVSVEYYENLTDQTKKDDGSIVITKATGTIKTLAEFKSTQDVRYEYDGDYATFNLGVEAGHKESALQYEVTGAKKANGDSITDATEIANKLLSISADGIVTLKGAGSAKITISLPGSTNYIEADPLTVDVKIWQANLKAPVIYRDYLFLRGGSDSIDLAELLPKDCGEVTYGAVTTSDSKSILEGTPTLSQDGKLSYAVKAGGTVGDEATITVSVSTANYTINNGYGIKVEIKLIDQLPIQPKGSISLKTDTLTYGEALSSLQFNSVTFADKATGKTVLGKLSFDEPDKKLDAGQYQEEWTFIPSDDQYAPYTGLVTVTVKKAKPKLTKAPVTEEMVFHPYIQYSEDLLNDKAKTQGVVTGVAGSPVKGTWKFTDPEVLLRTPAVGTRTFEIYFEPDSMPAKNYDCTDIKANVTITIKKAKPYISDVKPGTYTHGDYLYNQVLNGTAVYGNGMGSEEGDRFAKTVIFGTYTWKTPSTKLSHVESNGKTYEYIFTPNDTTSYEIVTGSVAVTVNKAQNPAVMPGSTMNVANSCEKVSSVKLPAGWAWNTTDAESALSVDTPVSATAEYTVADKDNYVNTMVTVQITRSSCEHKTTKVEKVIPATCSKEGSTGQVVCEDCGAVVETASATAKNPANHTALTETVVRAATTSQTGLRVSDCTACGYHAEVTIPKLSGGSTGGNSGNGGSVPQPETTGDNAGAGSQNTSGGSDSGSNNGNSNGSTGGGQGTAITPVSPKPQNPAPQPEETRPGNTQQNRTNSTDGGNQTADTAEPFIKGENGKEGWEVIHDEVTAAKEGETVSVDMNGTTTVPGAILSQISGKDITLVLDMGSGITWSINGKSFTGGEVGDIDFGVTYGEQAGTNIPVDVINNVTGERYSMNLTLAYDGEFGFSAVLSINMDGKNAGLYANLFYYNPESGELEFICAGQIGEDGNAELTFTHASDYTIVIDTEPMDQADAGDAVEAAADTDKTPDADNAGTVEPAKEDTDTAAGWIILIVVILAVAAAAGAVVLQKRRRQK